MTASPLVTQTLAATKSTVYTSTNAGTTITAAVLCNTTASPVTVSIYVTRSGTEATVYDAVSVPANDTIGLPFLVAQALGRADSIAMEAGSGSAVDATLSGVVA